MRRIGQYTLLVLGGIVAGLVLLEVALQIAAAMQRSSEKTLSFAWDGDGTRVLTIGDSNTYGLYVGQENAYPAVFEEKWNASGLGKPVDVMNLGRPGMNSSLARALLDDVLDDVKPDVLFLMIGANDFWVPVGADASWWQRSRVLKLFTMLRLQATKPNAWPTFEPEHIEVAGKTHEIAFGGQAGLNPGWKDELRANLIHMIRQAEAADIRVVLLTYPADDDTYGLTNRRIRLLANELGVPLVDLGLALRRRCPAVKVPNPNCKGFDCLKFGPKLGTPHSRCGLLIEDGHPSIAGHDVTADELIAAYARLRAEKTPKN